MIPSRGLRWSSQTIGAGRRRIETLSARNFSSTVQQGLIRATPLLSKNSALVSKAYSRPQFSRTNLLIRNGAGTRFASTAPAAAATTTSPSANVAASSPSDAVSSAGASPAEITTPLENLTDFTSDSLYNIPESIGYLKSLGLDYGWGPTAMMEWTLEHVHIFAGTPWWASIALTAVLVRAVLFKPYINAAENSARMTNIAPVTKPIQRKMTAAQKLGDTDGVLKARQELQMVYKRAGIKISRSFVPMLQVFAGYGTFVLLRAMARLPVPGLETGGMLWFYNLTIPDPFYLFPIATAGVLHWVLRRGGETGTTTLSPEMAKALTYGLPGLTLLFTWWLPAAVQISFFVSGLLSFAQASMFKSPVFRNYFGMTPLSSTNNPTAPPSPYKGTIKLAASAPAPASGANATPKSSPVLSTSELNSRFEASSISNESTSPPRSKLLSKFLNPINEARDSARGVMKKANESMDGRREKNEIAEKRKYELKRQEELRKERWKRENERRAERAAKKVRDTAKKA